MYDIILQSILDTSKWATNKEVEEEQHIPCKHEVVQLQCDIQHVCTLLEHYHSNIVTHDDETTATEKKLALIRLNQAVESAFLIYKEFSSNNKYHLSSSNPDRHNRQTAIINGCRQHLHIRICHLISILQIIDDSEETSCPWEIPFEQIHFNVDRYGQWKHLGSGSFGIVYDATVHDTPVAVKKLHYAGKDWQVSSFESAFRREVGMIFRLCHPNIVDFIGAIAESGEDPIYMIVTEKLPETLTTFSKRATLGERKTVVMGIISGLSYLHSCGVIHRDIKPDNIMLTQDQTPKFIDFGLSKEKEEHQVTIQPTTIQLGTFLWMSPEKKEGKRSTCASDIYSVGLVIANLLTGILPNKDKSPIDTYSTPLKEIFFIGDSHDSNTKEEDLLYHLLLQCLEEDPTKRPTAEEFHFQLKQQQQPSNDTKSISDNKVNVDDSQIDDGVISKSDHYTTITAENKKEILSSKEKCQSCQCEQQQQSTGISLSFIDEDEGNDTKVEDPLTKNLNEATKRSGEHDTLQCQQQVSTIVVSINDNEEDIENSVKTEEISKNNDNLSLDNNKSTTIVCQNEDNENLQSQQQSSTNIMVASDKDKDIIYVEETVTPNDDHALEEKKSDIPPQQQSSVLVSITNQEENVDDNNTHLPNNNNSKVNSENHLFVQIEQTEDSQQQQQSTIIVSVNNNNDETVNDFLIDHTPSIVVPDTSKNDDRSSIENNENKLLMKQEENIRHDEQLSTATSSVNDEKEMIDNIIISEHQSIDDSSVKRNLDSPHESEENEFVYNQQQEPNNQVIVDENEEKTENNLLDDIRNGASSSVRNKNCESQGEQNEMLQYQQHPSTVIPPIDYTDNNADIFVIDDVTKEYNVDTENIVSIIESMSVNDVEKIIDLMRKHPLSFMVQSVGCQTLVDNINDYPQTGENDFALCVIETILGSMGNYPENDQILSDGTFTLGNLACGIPRNKEKIVELGGIETILGSMTNFHENDQLQTRSCLALANIANGFVEHKERIVEQDGIFIILKSMKNFPENAQLQSDGAFVLASLVAGISEHKVRIVESNGLDRILASMQTFPFNDKVQSNGCLALSNIACGVPAHKETIVESSGIETILASMRNFPHIDKVQGNASSALANIAYGNPKHKEKIVALDGIETIVDSMRNFDESAKVQCNACLAFANIASGVPEYAERIVLLDGLILIQKARENFPANESLQYLGKSAVTTIQSTITGTGPGNWGIKKFRFPSLRSKSM